ncbi:TerB family tellurite resistance protein [Cyanobacterium sp. IPPAS B-1200]|uniref:tellurite resistance TerB family protein n=1 Tax=Cyanobacterium sp. IPPAS B-1200 TaxID=1562720 RepID=UPI0008527F5F|nr:TerB family tellurite resistance protein [Cyanobacterium sp. IPPAS B-1200]OEJ78997.1 Tellurite resistance protein TerB [Cyanobacterium sp. IPPAS B-1200]
MNTANKTKLLMKIVIGAAWIDGIIHQEERDYLKKMARETELIDDPEIKSLLSEVKPISTKQCYQWLELYLGKTHNINDYQKLLESISGLVYSDGDIDVEEAKLLHYLQDLNPQNQTSQSIFKSLLGSVKKMYSQAVNS